MQNPNPNPTRRTNQQPRKDYRQRVGLGASSTEATESESITLEDWDKLFTQTRSEPDTELMDS